MGSIAIDMTGQRFGRLVALARAFGAHGNRRAWWAFRCDCGQAIVLDGQRVRRGATKSCGCLRNEVSKRKATKHNLSYSRSYRAWAAAKTRCYNTKQPGFARYGGRGITMHPLWRREFGAFYRDMGECPAGHTLERIDNEQGYMPDNCRWATRLEQAQNKSTTVLLTLNGETASISEWERRKGFKPGTIKRRLQRGWSHLKALTALVRS